MPTRPVTGIDCGIVAPVWMLRVGFERDTVGKLTLAEKGEFPAMLYTSFPWMRSYMIPYPPRSTVLPEPVRLYAKPRRGPKFSHAPFTHPVGSPCVPQMPTPFR